MKNILTLGKDEKIILRRRKHWFYFLGGFSGFFFASLVPPALYFAAEYFQPGIVSPFAAEIWSFVFLFWAGLLSFFLKFWVDYYLDLWLVTNQRIINVEQRGFFSREVSVCNLSRIQDVSVEVNGPLQTLMDFGDVHVQTAGEAREFLFHQVPRPREVQEKIIELNRQTG